MARIGIVGFGYIGSYIYQQIATRPELGLEVAFVNESSRERVRELPSEIVLEDLYDFPSRAPDLICEVAHPSVTLDHGEQFLKHCDYMPLSLTAFANAGVLKALIDVAKNAGTCLYIPHGAAVGIESISECRHIWEEITVKMRKNPKNLDFSASPHLNRDFPEGETVLFDGPTGEVCFLFPRNVNSHAAVALAGLGFHKTRSVLIADPSLEASVIEVLAKGSGVEMKIQRRNPLKGVSGVFTLLSTFSGITRSKGSKGSMQFC